MTDSFCGSFDIQGFNLAAPAKSKLERVFLLGSRVE